MVWGAMSFQGPGILKVVHGNLNSKGYIDILSNCAIPSPHLLVYGDENWYQDDGVSCHRAKVVKEWHSQKSIRCLENWPPHSPDLNPIENVWHDIKMKFGNKHHGNLRELSMIVIPCMS
jgi:transposase